MGRASPSAALAAGAVLALAFALPGLAHEGEEEPGIAVEPSSVTAGGSILVAGTNHEPATDRVLVLAGGPMTIDFGTVRADAEGIFRAELAIPAHLPGGLYELRCIGDETLTAELRVLPAAMEMMPTPAPTSEPAPTSGAASLAPTPAQVGALPSAAPTLAPTPMPEQAGLRPRSATELGILGVVALLLVLVGALLVVRAEAFRGATPAG